VTVSSARSTGPLREQLVAGHPLDEDGHEVTDRAAGELLVGPAHGVLHVNDVHVGEGHREPLVHLADRFDLILWCQHNGLLTRLLSSVESRQQHIHTMIICGDILGGGEVSTVRAALLRPNSPKPAGVFSNERTSPRSWPVNNRVRRKCAINGASRQTFGWVPMLLRPATSASTETSSPSRAWLIKDVVDQFRLALEDPGEPVLRMDPRGQVPQPPGIALIVMVAANVTSFASYGCW